MYEQIINAVADKWVSVSNDNLYKTDDIVRFIGNYLGFFSSLYQAKLVNECADGEIGLEPSNQKGKFLKRLARYVYKDTGIRLDMEILGEAFTKELSTTQNIGSFCITKDVTWDEGDYGDSNSCYWSCHSLARLAIKRHMYALIFKNINGKGCGRMWLQPRKEGILLFNSYPGGTTDKFVSILKEYLNLTNIIPVSLANEKIVCDWLYINSGSERLLTHRDLDPNSKIDIDLHIPKPDPKDFDEYLGDCNRCNRPVWGDISHINKELNLPDNVRINRAEPSKKLCICYKCSKSKAYTCTCGNRHPYIKAYVGNSSRMCCEKCIDRKHGYVLDIKTNIFYLDNNFLVLPEPARDGRIYIRKLARYDYCHTVQDYIVCRSDSKQYVTKISPIIQRNINDLLDTARFRNASNDEKAEQVIEAAKEVGCEWTEVKELNILAENKERKEVCLVKN